MSRFWGKASMRLRHVENLPQRLPIMLTAGLIAAAAVGAGDLVLRRLRLITGLRAAERIALGYGLGAGLIGVLTLLLGRLGWLHPWLFRVVFCVLAVVGLTTSRLWRAGRFKLSASSCTLLMVIAPFVAVMILGSMLPSIDFDVLEYHLQGPKEYYKAGRIAFLPHNVYTSMPFGVEMLHLAAMEVMGDWWWGGLAGQVLVALFAPAAAVLMAGAASRIGSSRAGWFAAVVYLSTPWIYRLAVLAYVEGPLCFYHAAARVGGRRRRCRSLHFATFDLDCHRPSGRLRHGLQIPGFDLGGHPFRRLLTFRLQAKPVVRARALLRCRLGDRDGAVADQECAS